MNKKIKNKLRFLPIIAVILVGIAFAVSYLLSYSKATTTARAALAGNEQVNVVSEEGYYRFEPTQNETPETGILFYPGGKVDEIAYAPLASRLAECGYSVFLVHMPFHLAVFDSNAAEDIMEANPDLSHWIIMGHSLGGAMAANYVSGHENEIEGLVLLAAYSTKDLSQSDIKVLSMYGSNDGVLNMKKYQSNKKNLPKDMTEYIIDGGNHAGYGYYGAQNGDNVAEISQREQQEEVVDLFLCVFGNKE